MKMVVSLNSVMGFKSTKIQISRSRIVGDVPRITHVSSLSSTTFIPRPFLKGRARHLHHLVAKSDGITTSISTESSGNPEGPLPSSLDTSPGSRHLRNGAENDSNPTSEASTSSSPISEPNKASSSPGAQTAVKKSSLTAREKLRAARVLSRYPESKPAKSEMGSKVLDAIKATEKGRKGLPEAPGNIFDDSDRGMPKQGLTFDFPGGIDLFFIVVSFVLISTVMFATTYIVWKLGAIHFNEY